MTISPEGGRVLGCLVEKQLTTPQQYPLTLNALASGCNQTTNRDPVMALDDPTIERALEELKARNLVRFVLPSHGRSVTRYRHVFDEAYGLDTQRVALLAVLLLRGPQTPGELRARTERMAVFDSLGELHHELDALARQPEPLAQLLPRRPGQKEDRWQQLVAIEAGAAEPSDPTDAVSTGATGARAAQGPDPEGVPPVRGSDRVDPADLVGRVESLETGLTELRDEVVALTDALGRLRRSLGDDDPG